MSYRKATNAAKNHKNQTVIRQKTKSTPVILYLSIV